MKKLKFVLAVGLAALTLFSCSSDDDSASSPSIKGLWKIDKVVIDDEVEPFEECAAYQTLEFTNSIAINTFFEGTNCTSVKSVNSADYSYSNMVLTITESDGAVEEIDVEELSSSTLVLKPNNGDEVEITFKR